MSEFIFFRVDFVVVLVYSSGLLFFSFFLFWSSFSKFPENADDSSCG